MAIGSHWWLAVPVQFADHWRTVGRSESNLRQIPCCGDVCRSGNLRWQTDGLPCFPGDVGLAPKAKVKSSWSEAVRRQPVRVTDAALISCWPVSATHRENRLFFRRKTSPRKPTSDACKSFAFVIFTQKNFALEDYGLYFYDPSNDKVELVKDGSDTPVTISNLQ